MRTILFVDDHPIFREGMRRTLESEIDGLTIVPVATAGAARLVLETNTSVDLVLTDYKLPDEDGLALIASVRKSHPTVGTGLLCADLTFALLAKARSLGAMLCMSKARSTGDLVTAVKMAFEGTEIYDDKLAPQAPDPVSPRRRQVLELASKGFSDKTIGERLGVSENTVRNHWKYIFEQLRVSSRTEAVGKAIREGTI